MKSPELSEFFSLLGKAKKEKKEEFDNLLKEADINLDVLTSTVVSGIKEAKVNIKKQKKKEEKLIEQLDSIIDVIENPKEVKDITEPAVTVGVPEDFDISKLEEDPIIVQDWNNGEDIKFTEVDAVDIIKPEPIKTPEISDTVAQAIKFIEETNIKEEIENSDETSIDDLKGEIKQVRDILYKVLSHGPGSGEVNLLKLDDVDEDSAKVDGKYLKYQSSTGKFVGADASGGGGGGSGITTANVRTGILDVAGIATFRNDTLIGSGVTLSPDGHIFVTGVTTSSSFVGDLTGDVTGTASNATQLNSQAASYYLNYNNFTNTPTIPSNNNQLTNGAGYITTSFTNTNQLTNGAGFITASDIVNTTGVITASQFSGFSHLIAPYASTKTITVKVASKVDGEHRYYGTGSSSGYVLDNVQSPFLTLTPGRTYRFDVSDSSNSGHPFRFYLDAAKATAYTTGVTVGSGYVDLEVTDSTPTVLHYQCSSHGYMGNAIQVSSSNAIKLNSQAASYYLDYDNFTNTPTTPTNNNQLTNGAGYITTSFTNTNQLTNGAGFITASDDITGNAASATILENARTIGGVSFNGSANIDLPGVNSAGNQNTTGTSAGLTGTPNITVGSIIASTGTFSGNVTIGGTLSYEDVTNIDAVGIITANSGIVVGTGITLSKDGDGFFTGIVTATSYRGDGSQLTGISAGIGGDTGVDFNDNVKARFGTGNDLELFHSGSTAVIRENNSNKILIMTSGNITNQTPETFEVKSNNGHNRITASGSVLLFHNGTERIRTNSTGGQINGNLRLGTSGSGNIYLSGNEDANIGFSETNRVSIETDGSERLAIEPAGNINVAKNLKVVGVVTAASFSGDGSALTGIGGGIDTDSQGNTVGGSNAGDSFSSGSLFTGATQNTLFGFDTGTDITSGYFNDCFGYQAGANINSGNYNVCIGRQAGFDITTQSKIIAIGERSAYNTLGTGTIAIGYRALKTHNGTGRNCVVGTEAGTNTQGTGNMNVAFGNYTMYMNSTGGSNCAIGDQAMNRSTTGSKNVAIGKNAGDAILRTGDNNIMIGYYADASASDVSNEITLGDANINHLRVPGIGLTFTSSGALISGVCTATSFAGDGSALTGISQIGGSTGVDFDDNVKIRLGTGDDFEIFHNQIDNVINNVNTNLKIQKDGNTIAEFYRASNTNYGVTFGSGKIFVATITGSSGATPDFPNGLTATTGTFSSNTLVGSGVTLSPDGDVFATGVTTSTSFVGDLTGDVTGTASNATLAVSAQGLTGSPNVTVTNVNAVDAIISGNLSVAGTITSLDQNDILATGIITASSGVDLGDPGIVTLSSDTLTTTATSADTVASVSATVNRSATFQVQVTRGTQYHMTTINVIHDGTNAFLSEYGTIRTGEILATFDADISGGNLRLRVTPTSTASTVFKLSKTTIKV